jgi:hypothetical protein
MVSNERSLNTELNMTAICGAAITMLTFIIRRCGQPIKLVSSDMKHDRQNLTER